MFVSTRTSSRALLLWRATSLLFLSFGLTSLPALGRSDVESADTSARESTPESTVDAPEPGASLQVVPLVRSSEDAARWRLVNTGSLPLVVDVDVEARWAWVVGSSRIELAPHADATVVVRGDRWAARPSSDEKAGLAARAAVRFTAHFVEQDRPDLDSSPGSASTESSGSGAWVAARESAAAGLRPLGESREESFTLLASSAPALPKVEGFTVFTPSTDTRTVYVSSSQGSDAFDGLSPQTPKRTIAAAKPLMRHGFPDWMLLRRGDVFTEVIGQWRTSGRSVLEPQLISSYGESTERPRLDTGVAVALVTHGGAGSPPRIDHVALVGLHFVAHTHKNTGTPYGITLHQPSRDFLIEDCKLERYTTGIIVQAIGGRHEDIRIRRSIVIDCYDASGQGNPQGIYAALTDGLLIEECTIDHNGWNEDIPGAEADVFSHNIYMDTNTSGVVLRGNLITRGASHGAQMRSGGLAIGNLFVQNTISLMMAGGSGPQVESAHAIANVFEDCRNLGTNHLRGWGIDFNDVVGGSIRHNLFANNPDAGFPLPFMLDGNGFGGGVHNVLVEQNTVWDWGGAVYFTGNSSRLTNIVFRWNDLQDAEDVDGLVDHQSPSNVSQISSSNNRFYDAASPSNEWMQAGPAFQTVWQWKNAIGDRTSRKERATYLDPWRTVEDYAAFRGLAPNLDAFLEPFRNRPAGLWERDWSARGVNGWLLQGYAE